MPMTADTWLQSARVGAPPRELVRKLRLSPFYQKHVDVLGLPALASARVMDAALLEAGYTAALMLQGMPDAVKQLNKRKIRIAIMAVSEFTTDIPEHGDLGKEWNTRARGVGATTGRPASSGGEENLLGCPGDPYPTENIFIHELAHTIHTLGLSGKFDQRVRRAYQKAHERGLWQGTYADTNHLEYWSEGVQSYFHCNRPKADHDHNGINTREALRAHDPELFALVAEAFGGATWKYTPAKERRHQPHLAGVDFSRLPSFAFPATRGGPLEKAGPQRPTCSFSDLYREYGDPPPDDETESGETESGIPIVSRIVAWVRRLLGRGG